MNSQTQNNPRENLVFILEPLGANRIGYSPLEIRLIDYLVKNPPTIEYTHTRSESRPVIVTTINMIIQAHHWIRVTVEHNIHTKVEDFTITSSFRDALKLGEAAITTLLQAVRGMRLPDTRNEFEQWLDYVEGKA